MRKVTGHFPFEYVSLLIRGRDLVDHDSGGCRVCAEHQMKTGHRGIHIERALRQLTMITNRERGALSSRSSPRLTIRGKSQVASGGIRAVNGTPIKPSVMAIKEKSRATTTVFGILLILLIMMPHFVTFLHRRKRYDLDSTAIDTTGRAARNRSKKAYKVALICVFEARLHRATS